MTKVTEVQRKANVGERIRIVKPDMSFGDYRVGTEMTVRKAEADGCVYVEPYSDSPGTCTYICSGEYVVLETKEEAPVNENITVLPSEGDITTLPDESIGGVSREYREVKRKAAVGEKVRVFGHAWSEANGVFTVDSVIDEHDGYGDTIKYTVSGDPDFGTPYGDGVNYAVLEPTDIIRIEGVRYRLVKRTATAGERIIVIDDGMGTGALGGACFRKGNVATARDANRADFNGSGIWMINPKAYRVLEPVAAPGAATPTEPAADLAKQVEGLTEAVAKLTVQLRVAREDIVLVEEGVSGDIEALTKRISALEAASKAEQERRESAVDPLTRDSIVERAKADVAELERTTLAVGKVPTLGGGRESFYPRGNKTCSSPCDEVTFHVNQKKRTVVANIRYIDSKRVWARGIAKCAPDDCFNVHIGKAIALRRALGLEIPVEYVKAPQPTEPRVGDVVDTYMSGGSFHKRVTAASIKRMGGQLRMYHEVGGRIYTPFDPEYGDRIVDDSRSEVVADGPAKEVRAA